MPQSQGLSDKHRTQALIFRVAQEPNRNRKPEPSEPFSQEPNSEPEPPEPFSNPGVSQRPLTLILLQKYRDTNGRRIAIQIGGVYTTKRKAYFCKSIAIEMGGVSRYFSKVLGSGVDVTLLILGTETGNRNRPLC